MITSTQKYSPIILLLVVYVLLIWGKCVYFTHCITDSLFCIGTLSLFSIIRIFSTYGAIATAVTLLVFIYYNRVVSWTVMLIVDLWLIANLLYYRSYHDLLSIWSLDSINQLGLYEGIITPYLYWTDIIPLLFTICWIILIYQKGMPKHRWITPTLFVGSIVSTLLLFTPWSISANRNQTTINPFNAYYHDVSMGRKWYASTFSFIAHGVNELKALPKRWDNYDVPILTNIELTRYFQQESSPVKSNYNVVIVLFESLESWAVDTLIQEEEITPNINKLIANNNTLFINNINQQVNMGRSADAQLMIMTGLLPIEKGITCMRYMNNTYPSLAEASGATFKKMYIPTSPSAWNQNAMTPALGFDLLFAQEVSDRTIVNEVLRDISNQPSYFVTMTTMASHVPFKEYADSSSLVLCDGHQYANYLRSVHYTDACLKDLIDYCCAQNERPTLLVITGDHTTLDLPESTAIPFLLYASDGIANNSYIDVLQMDIFPTLLHQMGCSNYYWNGIGTNLLATTEDSLNSQHPHLTGSTQRILNANEISTFLIHTNYFERASKHYRYPLCNN